jgi:hypothetical protein
MIMALLKSLLAPTVEMIDPVLATRDNRWKMGAIVPNEVVLVIWNGLLSVCPPPRNFAS